MTEGAIDPPHERKQCLVLASQQRRQALADYIGVGEGSTARERLIAEPLRRGMILRIATGHSFQDGFVVQAAEALWKGSGHSVELRRLLSNGVANAIQLLTWRHPDARADHRPASGLEMEVEAGAPLIAFTSHATAGSAMMEPAGSVRLVRRLVLREPHVTVDPKHAPL